MPPNLKFPVVTSPRSSPSSIPATTALTMPPLPSSQCCARSLLRTSSRLSTSRLAATLPAQQRRHKADIVDRSSGQYDHTPRFESPFKDKDDNPTTKIPSFGHYMSKRGETSNKTFQYFMVGGMGLLAAAGAKATVQGESIDQLRLVVAGGLEEVYEVECMIWMVNGWQMEKRAVANAFSLGQIS